ncbi:tyrosine-type recombinase/integrase, partial [Streptomyces sp. NPDC002758]
MTTPVTRRSAAEPEIRPRTRSLAGSQLSTLQAQFPPRQRAESWPATEATAEEVLERLRQPPLRSEKERAQATRLQGARWLLRWLATFPGEDWQQRWQECPAAGNRDGWTAHVREWGKEQGGLPTHTAMTAGMLALVCADVIRPGLSWLASRGSGYLRTSIEATRDPEGFARLRAAIPPNAYESGEGIRARVVIAQLLAVYGGEIADIQVGDLLDFRMGNEKSKSTPIHLAYSWLRGLGQFPSNAPPTLMHLQVRGFQATPEQLIDRFQLQCRPVRDLLVAYLTERQPTLDYNSLQQLSQHLGRNFWADLERHHPGISSIDLPPDVRTAFKARMATKTVRRRQPDGTSKVVVEPRISAPAILQIIRAFYLDLAQWALDEPERWGQWAVPCPISDADANVAKAERQQRARSQQRTRERLPHLPTLVSAAERRHKEARERLAALHAAEFGTTFTVLGQAYLKAKASRRPDGETDTAYEVGGRRRQFGSKEKRAFWAWATIEILRHTGLRIEELQELSHHSIIRYTLPSTGEVVPLLQIAPSKTDQERLLLISPELADVLSAVVSRVRGPNGTIPLVSRYDPHEKVWNPPMPLLFQWSVSGDHRSIAKQTLVQGLNKVIEVSGLADKTGQPLKFSPHDFRRIFITDAILNGLPPHIAQVIAGHGDISTTMGYNKARELHQTGEKVQVASSRRGPDGLQRYYEAA